MNDDQRGWSSDSATVATWKVVVEALEHAQRSPGMVIDVQTAGARTQVGTAMARAAYYDAVGRGLLVVDSGIVPERYGLILTGTARVEVGRWVKSRESLKYRKIACREALLDWLYAQDGEVQSTDSFLGDVRASQFGKAFTADEIRRATEELVRDELVASHGSWQEPHFRLSLTPGGRTCVEAYDGVIADWQGGRRGQNTTSYNGDVWNISADGSTGTQIAAGSQNVRQRAEVSVTSGTANDLAELLTHFTALVEALPLGTADAEEARAGLAELRKELAADKPDRNRVRQALGLVFTAIASVAAEGAVQQAMQVGSQILLAVSATES